MIRRVIAFARGGTGIASLTCACAAAVFLLIGALLGEDADIAAFRYIGAAGTLLSFVAFWFVWGVERGARGAGRRQLWVAALGLLIAAGISVFTALLFASWQFLAVSVGCLFTAGCLALHAYGMYRGARRV